MVLKNLLCLLKSAMRVMLVTQHVEQTLHLVKTNKSNVSVLEGSYFTTDPDLI